MVRPFTPFGHKPGRVTAGDLVSNRLPMWSRVPQSRPGLLQRLLPLISCINLILCERSHLRCDLVEVKHRTTRPLSGYASRISSGSSPAPMQKLRYASGVISDGLISLLPPQNTFV